jgi:hypothetical protein
VMSVNNESTVKLQRLFSSVVVPISFSYDTGAYDGHICLLVSPSRQDRQCNTEAR